LLAKLQGPGALVVRMRVVDGGGRLGNDKPVGFIVKIR
jgi:hypothetical protein